MIKKMFTVLTKRCNASVADVKRRGNIAKLVRTLRWRRIRVRAACKRMRSPDSAEKTKNVK